jgi:hypothetical protein
MPKISPVVTVNTLSMKQPVTHEGYFNMDISRNKSEQRIFSGTDTPAILTVSLHSPPLNSTVEVIVNGSSIPDGVIAQTGTESRTFKIQNANHIDIRLVKPCTSGYGDYTLSVHI